jgi:hypothetical protein
LPKKGIKNARKRSPYPPTRATLPAGLFLAFTPVLTKAFGEENGGLFLPHNKILP